MVERGCLAFAGSYIEAPGAPGLLLDGANGFGRFLAVRIAKFSAMVMRPCDWQLLVKRLRRKCAVCSKCAVYNT